jgi:hypothetical protein
MAHIAIMSGSTAMNNKHLRPNYGKRDSNSASCQNIDRAGIGGDNPESGGKELYPTQSQIRKQKYKTCAYFGVIGLVVVLTVIIIILAATGAFDKDNS